MLGGLSSLGSRDYFIDLPLANDANFNIVFIFSQLFLVIDGSFIFTYFVIELYCNILDTTLPALIGQKPMIYQSL